MVRERRTIQIRDSDGPNAERLYRGGAWNFELVTARCSFRLWEGPDVRYAHLGFRLAKKAAGRPVLRSLPRSPARSMPVPSEELIVPGERVGKLRIGMSVREVDALNLPPEGKTETYPPISSRYPHLEVRFHYLKVNEILVLGGLYGTKEGLRVGRNTMDDVRAAYGSPSRSSPEVLSYPGIEFQFTGGVLGRITVLADIESTLRSKPYSSDVAVEVDYKKGFDWRDVIPHLNNAAELGGEEGIRSLLQNTAEFRLYLALELRDRCPPQGQPICNAKLGEPELEAYITRKTDEIVKANLKNDGGFLTVEQDLSSHPLTFEYLIAMVRRGEALLLFKFTVGNRISPDTVEAQYGPAQGSRFDSQSRRILTYEKPAVASTAMIEYTFEPDEQSAYTIGIHVKPNVSGR